MKNRLELFIASLNDQQLHRVERSILDIANSGETKVIYDVDTRIIADDILNY